MKPLFLFLSVCFTLFAFGQTSTDQQLANLYYNNGDYQKALPYLEKIYLKQGSKFETLRYIDCLVKTERSKEAEKVLKKQIASTNDFDYTMALGDLYERTEHSSQTEKLYQEHIKKASDFGPNVISLYQSFVKKGKVEWALKTLEEGRKNLKKNYPLHFQFAEVYGLLGQTDNMIQAYFDILDTYPNYLSEIESELTKQIDFEEDRTGIYQKLKTQLLSKIQKNPSNTIYPEMFIWLLVQKKEFPAALMQAQALDKREKGEGYRVLELAESCIENEDYETARKAYLYVVEFGNSNPYYYRAYEAMLSIRFKEITQLKKYTPASLIETEKEYRKGLKILGWGRNAVHTATELAIIKAYYANQVDQAIELLDSCMKVSGLTDMELANVKMNLADILVLKNDIWQASLLYMQIDKDFKYEVIGSEAKFKNARIYYYSGEFKFAQSQLDVLKQSTSKLIANDAMKLSILITDNLGLDSNYTAMYQFAQADLLLEQHQFDRAFTLYDSINQAFPAHGLSDEILYRKAFAMKTQGKWQEAIDLLQKIYSQYRNDILADDALFEMAEIYERNLLNKETAEAYYKKLLLEFKGSLLQVEARKRLRSMRGDEISN